MFSLIIAIIKISFITVYGYLRRRRLLFPKLIELCTIKKKKKRAVKMIARVHLLSGSFSDIKRTRNRVALLTSRFIFIKYFKFINAQ